MRGLKSLEASANMLSLVMMAPIIATATSGRALGFAGVPCPRLRMGSLIQGSGSNGRPPLEPFRSSVSPSLRNHVGVALTMEAAASDRAVNNGLRGGSRDNTGGGGRGGAGAGAGRARGGGARFASGGPAGVTKVGATAAGDPRKKILQDMPANRISRTSATTMSQITDSMFSSLEVHPATKEALAKDMRYANMTMVQQQTIPVSLTGVDVIAKAKTGTGKTLAFLIPAIENCVRTPKKAGQISSLIISPTRELAMQIMEEAEMLVGRHSPRLKVMCIVGGTNMNRDIKGFQNPPDILVATPGRLNDHLENGSLQSMLKSLRCLVFDEADQLLDMGFRPAITKTLSCLPDKKGRQTLLFSATLPKDVQAVSEIATREGMVEFVDTVGEEENTHQHVEQEVVVTSIGEQPMELYKLVKEAMREDEAYKIIAFFTTARQTQLHAELFNKLGFPVLEIHSRLSQPARKRVSEEFRNSKGGSIMFTSDVSARGLDYPDVTKVLQVGAPSDRAQYVHRLGRTARAGKAGSGALLLCDFEKYFLKEIKDLPIQTRAASNYEAGLKEEIDTGFSKLDDKTLCTAYQVMFGREGKHAEDVRCMGGDV